MKSFTKNISKEQARDTGMAAVLILLLLGYFLRNDSYYKISIIVLIIDMIIPTVFAPAAVIWLGLSKVIGKITSKIILTLIFFLVVLPIGFFRKKIGKDSLQLKKFKKGTDSVFVERNHLYTFEDLEKPY